MRYGQHYDSIYDAIDDILNCDYTLADDERSSITSSEEFCASVDMADALDKARNGWDEHADSVADLVRRVMDSTDIVRLIEEKVPQRVRGVAGGRVDIGRYLADDPRCMVRRKRIRGERTRKVLTMVVEVGCSGGTSTEAMIQQGAAITGLIDVLTVIGYSVELIAESSVNPGGGSSNTRDVITHSITVKHADEPLDLPSVLFAIAHPSMLRRIAFALREMLPTNVRHKFGIGRDSGSRGGYGRTASSSQIAEEVGADLVIGRGSAHVGTDSIEWIRRQVEALVG